MLPKTYFFCGIGGSGMSSLAQVLAAKGHKIFGSDRDHDAGKHVEKFAILAKEGIKLFPQDGSGVTQVTPDFLIVSTAVEDSIPDVAAAKSAGIPIKKRAELLAEFFNAFPKSIAVGGTSGKSTVTAMISHILTLAKKNPTTINGAVMTNALHYKQTLGNMVVGGDEICVIEADESDGSIEFYNPTISVLTNISEDHKPMEELCPIFKRFVDKAKMGNVINMDCPEAVKMASPAPKTRSFTINSKTRADIIAKDIKASNHGISFNLGIKPVNLHVQGKHNVANAVAAIAAASFMGVSLNDSIASLGTFKGVKRRLETVGKIKGVTVIDDFAHNPDKIRASLDALHEHVGKVWIIYQPQGFGPTKFLKDAFINTFVTQMNPTDELVMPEIYYAGGTVEKNISSQDIINGVSEGGKNAQFFPTRAEIIPHILANVKYGDRIVVMGARDDSLTEFANEILGLLN